MSSGTTVSRPPLPIFQYFVLPQLFLSLVIAIRPRFTWRLLAFLVICYAHLKGVTFTLGNKDKNNAQGGVFGWLIANALHLLLLSDPINDFRRAGDLVPPGDLPLPRRTYWAFCLHAAVRGIGWNYELPHTPPATNELRWSFVRSQLIRALRYLFILDAAESYMHWNLLFSHPGNVSFPISAQGYGFRCVNIIAFMGRVYWTLRSQYALLCAFCVAIGLYEAKDCPPLCGRWRDAYTVRRLWGRTWHQNMRRFVASIGKSTARGLGFKPGSRSSSYTQLYVGFFVSALLHTLGDAMVGMQYVGSSFWFFQIQAIAITVEDAVIGLARRAGIDKSISLSLTRVIGYTWVFLWFSVSMPWYLNWQIAAGLKSSVPLPISPIRHAVTMLNETMGEFFMPPTSPNRGPYF